MTFRESVVVAHRWVGLATCAVLALVGLTGVPLLFDQGTFLERVAGRLHQTLALGPAGRWIVFLATVNACLLQMSGLYLWWRRKAMRVKIGAGWRRLMFDLHHAGGAIGFPFMLMLAATGAAMVWPGEALEPAIRRTNMTLHTGRTFAWPIQILYAIFSLGFVVQGVTGFVMWWKPLSPARTIAGGRAGAGR